MCVEYGMYIYMNCKSDAVLVSLNYEVEKKLRPLLKSLKKSISNF